MPSLGVNIDHIANVFDVVLHPCITNQQKGFQH